MWLNERVKRQCDVRVDVIGQKKKSVLHWFGYMELIENGRLVKKMCGGGKEQS